jgi:tRNA threonylcarbamoyladenosine biosynthesis protein TsaB
MSLILNIETATRTCSVALAENGKLLALAEEHDIQSHASKITLFIHEVLKKSNKNIEDIDAIAISIGPGSYTGLRIGLSTAKGLCYALNKPLISVDTLHALAAGMSKENKDKDALFIPNMDARRNEIYYAVFDSELETIQSSKPLILDENTFNNYQKKLIFGGNGNNKIQNTIVNRNFDFSKVKYSSVNMIQISYKMLNINKFSNVSYIEPKYLKPFLKS